MAWGIEPRKSQIPSTKLQTNLKFQYSMTKTGLEFRILVIVICLIFDICDLEFLILPYPNTPRALVIFVCILNKSPLGIRLLPLPADDGRAPPWVDGC